MSLSLDVSGMLVTTDLGAFYTVANSVRKYANTQKYGTEVHTSGDLYRTQLVVNFSVRVRTF